MRLSQFALAALIALTAFIGVPSATRADSGSISFRVIKAGFVVGGSGGSGVLYFHGRVSNIRRPSDVAGIYAAGGVGAAVGVGVGAIVLTNQNGAVLSLSGRQAGLIIAADLNGLAISLR